MDILVLYQEISSWIGWPITFVIYLGITLGGYWLLNNRISQLKEHNDFLSNQLEESKNFRPDVVATRLAERHKQLTDVIELLNADLQKNKEEIQSRETELKQTKDEIGALSEQLEKAYLALNDEIPREGKLSAVTYQYLVQSAQIHSALFIPLRPMSELFDAGESFLNIDVPFKLTTDNSMFQIHICVETSKGQFIAEIINPFDAFDVYNNDFKVTLLEVIAKFIENNDTGFPSFKIPDNSRIVPIPKNIENLNELDWFLIIPMTTKDIIAQPPDQTTLQAVG